MNPIKIRAYLEIAQWIKYDGFTIEDIAEILRAVNKKCLEVRGVTASELMAKKACDERTKNESV